MTLEELIDQYGDGILRLCLIYLGERQLAEDAFQETFLKAWRSLPGFRGDSSSRTWLTRRAQQNSPPCSGWTAASPAPAASWSSAMGSSSSARPWA